MVAIKDGGVGGVNALLCFILIVVAEAVLVKVQVVIGGRRRCQCIAMHSWLW